MIPLHKGKIERGTLILDEPDAYSLWLGSLEGKRVEVIVRREKHDRTNQQNEYYWGVVVDLISKHTGYSPDNTHTLLKSMFLKAHITIKDKRYTVVRSTAKLTTVEFGEYIEKTKQWASQELGLFIPEPNTVEIG